MFKITQINDYLKFMRSNGIEIMKFEDGHVIELCGGLIMFGKTKHSLTFVVEVCERNEKFFKAQTLLNLKQGGKNDNV